MAAASSSVAPGRPRRQQVYRRANTSLTLSSVPGGYADADPDPYISCTNILDRFGTGSGGSTGPDSTMNGNGTRKMSAGAIKDFLLGRRDPPPPPPPPLPSSHLNHDYDDSIYPSSSSSAVTSAPYESAIIEDLKISSVPRLQPKYSYLIGRTAAGHKTANGDTDFWRKSNAVSIVNSNPYQSSTSQTSGYVSSSRRSSQQYPTSTADLGSFADYERPNYLSYSSASHKSYLNDNTPSSASSTAYEDRISTALRKGAPTPSLSSSVGSSYNVKKSKSYGNFDSLNRDFSFQVRLSFSFYSGCVFKF